MVKRLTDNIFIYFNIQKKNYSYLILSKAKKNLLRAGLFYFPRSKSAYFFPYTFIFLFLILDDFGQKIATLVSCL